MFKDQDYPRSPENKPGWKMTFCDDFDVPVLDDMYWYPAYRSGRKEYFKRIGHPSRWQNHNACYEIADSILKLRITPDRPFRKNPLDWCVSCLCTSDHRFGKTTDEVQILEKFAQEYGRFEIRCRCASAKGGIMSSRTRCRPRSPISPRPRNCCRSIASMREVDTRCRNS